MCKIKNGHINLNPSIDFATKKIVNIACEIMDLKSDSLKNNQDKINILENKRKWLEVRRARLENKIGELLKISSELMQVK